MYVQDTNQGVTDIKDKEKPEEERLFLYLPDLLQFQQRTFIRVAKEIKADPARGIMFILPGSLARMY